MFSSIKQRSFLRFIALLTAVITIFSVSTYWGVVQPVFAADQTEEELLDEISKLEKEREKLQKEQNQLKKDLADEKDKQASYEKQIKNVEKQLESYRKQIDTVNDAIAQTNQKIANKEKEIENTNLNIKEKQKEIEKNDELFKERLDAMYIANSSNSVLAMLLGAESFSDFLSATETVKSISDQDQKLLAELDQQHKELEKLKQKQLDDKKELETAKQEKETQKAKLVETKSGFEKKNNELNELYKQSGITIDNIKDKQNELDERMEENGKAIEESQANLKKIQDAANEADKDWENNHGGGSGGSGGSSGVNPSTGYMWPLNGGRITCRYGGYPGHRGTDLSTGIVGTSIYASRSGVVVDVQYWDGHSKSGMQSYGNMVRLYHPETKTYTRYAHCNSLAVSEGQWVNQGQTIAYMGNTGNSFGAHLHFELSTGASNSTRINPEPYIT